MKCVKTIHLIIVTSLHDCKIVNTDYLLSLFYTETREGLVEKKDLVWSR